MKQLNHVAADINWNFQFKIPEASY
jgi:hypothetical protein